ncbi:DUF3500 domain-containing protein [Calycomorphotria hydatis]|uniref:DUF3500 domain-containing protein n=1 Tax=Calycomorphotria hydatis TaxID=2528027 RepID=A0A517T7P9_9PLAN|nr:DUF3500 domain-containing protein [Calycomorphotria hydatis]QDT64397.1 hypothetical protein V22_16310 [Calycomorphotria hydatis]
MSDCCASFLDQMDQLNRRRFMEVGAAGSMAVAAGSALGAEEVAKTASTPSAENLVKDLFESLTPQQRKTIAFPWDHHDGRSGKDVPLRLTVRNNWRITQPSVISPFYTTDQQEMIEAIFYGLYDKEWHGNIKKQLRDDAGGYGRAQSIAIFGEPGTGKFEFVMTGRHLTIRCDGDSTDHYAFGGPIFYGHAAESFNEKPNHPGNVFWPQAVKANHLFEMLDGKQREQALLLVEPSEEEVQLQGENGNLPGLKGRDMTSDQREHLDEVLTTLLAPFRESDRQEVERCLKAQGGLEECALSFYETGDIGDDGVWDNWRLEGPSFVWYFRGSPHVHVWVNVAENASTRISTS